MQFGLLKNTLVGRGYWEEADAGEGGDGAGGAPKVEPPVVEPPVIDPNKMSDKEADLLKDLMKQKTKNKESEVAILAMKAELSKFDGINLEEIKALLDSKKDSENKKLEDQGQWDLLKKQMAEENSKLVKVHSDKTVELQTLADFQQQTINKLTLGHSFNTSNFIANDLTLSSDKTRIIYGSHFELDGDKIVAYDKPKGSQDRVQLVDASGDSLGFEESLRKIIDADPDKDRLIRVKSKTGSNSSTTGNKVDLTNKTELKGMDRISKALDDQKK